MRPIASRAGQQLLWLQPARTKRAYELRAADELLATLAFRSGTLASAEVEGQQWTFKREGFWHPQVTVRAPGDESNIATFRPHFGGGGELRDTDDRPFHLSTANFWHTEWVWQQGDQVLVHYRGLHGTLKASGMVEIEPEAAELAQLPLLTVVGWYLILLSKQDQALTAAATASRVAIFR